MIEYLQDFRVSSQSPEFWDVCGVAVCDSLPETVKNIILYLIRAVPTIHAYF